MIWDLPLRIFHWLLVIFVALAWYTVKVSGDMDLHMLAGQAILALLIFRIIWGFIGTRHSLFKNFIFGIKEVIFYLKSIFSSSAKKYVGHNPLGSIAVFIMLSLLLFQTITGLFATDYDGYFKGPLNDFISSAAGSSITGLHHENFELFIVSMIFIHLFAIFFHLLVKKENLIFPMFSGKKGDIDASEEIKESKIIKALIALLAASIIVLLLSNI
ncbi:MAG: cytochrome b/b6 domain-containing protein [Pseudomonadota bacterium]|nr:cytochrome b/b6 domain-containing protein [Pseudomonadota bacterium]